MTSSDDKVVRGWNHLIWERTFYPEVETAWEPESDCFLARWVDLPDVGLMAHSDDSREASVHELMSGTALYMTVMVEQMKAMISREKVREAIAQHLDEAETVLPERAYLAVEAFAEVVLASLGLEEET